MSLHETTGVDVVEPQDAVDPTTMPREQNRPQQEIVLRHRNEKASNSRTVTSTNCNIGNNMSAMTVKLRERKREQPSLRYEEA